MNTVKRKDEHCKNTNVFLWAVSYSHIFTWWYTVVHGDAREGRCRGNWRTRCIQHYYCWCAHLGCQ